MNLLNVFLVWLPYFSLNPLVTILVAPSVTGIIISFMFHIRCVSLRKLLYYFLFCFLCMTFLSADIATSISMHALSFSFLIIIIGLFSVASLSVCIML